MNQARLAEQLGIDPGQVSRWATGKAVPHVQMVSRIEAILAADLSQSFAASVPEFELYVSAPIASLDDAALRGHHDEVSSVVEALADHVSALYWPGWPITKTYDLVAADIATERNFRIIAHCTALLYLQFAPIIRPSSALIELGFALGRRLKTTVIVKAGLEQAYMLENFGAVAASLSFLPKARLYTVRSVADACDLVGRNGRELLGLT